MIQKIDSLANLKIKHLAKLLDSSKERKMSREFVLEGLRLCFDCIKNSPIEAESVFFTAKAYQKSEDGFKSIINEIPSFEISEAIAKKLARTENSQGVFVLCKMPDNELSDIDYSGKYLALDNVQNPDNFGAICRSAEALGIDGIIVSGGVDIYNPKSLRASMGSALRMNIIRTECLKDYLEKCKANSMTVIAMVPYTSAKKITELNLDKSVIAVIGNEANGVSEDVKSVCELVTIPMKGQAESLNAATAAAITIWEIMR